MPKMKIANDSYALSQILNTASPTTLLREFVFNGAEEVNSLALPADHPERAVFLSRTKGNKLIIMNRSREIPPDEAVKLFGDAFADNGAQSDDGHGRHGIGAKLMGLRFSPFGTVFHWKHDGKIYMMKISMENGEPAYTDPVVVKNYPMDTKETWVTVTLYGENDVQPTWSNPQTMVRWDDQCWMMEQMRLRHWDKPFGVPTKLRQGVRRDVLTFKERLDEIETNDPTLEANKKFVYWHQPVQKDGVLEVTYVWDPEERMFADINAYHSTNFIALGYQLHDNEEFYDLLRGAKLSNNAPKFNLSGVHRFLYIIITLDTTPDIMPSLNRMHLQRKSTGEQLSTLDYAEVVKEHMPQELKDLITAMRPRPTDDDKKFSSDLIKQLGLTVQAPIFPKAKNIKVVPDPNGTHTATTGGRGGPHNVVANPQGRASPHVKSSLTVVSPNPNGKPRWAKPAPTVGAVPLPEPEVTRLETPEQVKDYELEGRIGRYETTTNTLYVNTLFGPALGLIAAVVGSPEAQMVSDLGREDVAKMVWNEIRQVLIATALRCRKWSLDGVFVDGQGYEAAKEYEAATNGVGLTAAFAGAIHHHLEPRAMKFVTTVKKREAA